MGEWWRAVVSDQWRANFWNKCWELQVLEPLPRLTAFAVRTVDALQKACPAKHFVGVGLYVMLRPFKSLPRKPSILE